jgi:hypothetical protein
VVVLAKAGRHKYAERPPACWLCGLHSWWCGSRTTKLGVRRRARCTGKGCQAGSWTVYTGDAYPHRRSGLLVVVAVVAAIAAGQTRTAAAAEHDVSRTSATRWVGWVASLAEPAALARDCTRLDPDGIAPPATRGDDEQTRAGATLVMLERIVDGCLARGARLLGEGRGLPRLLGHQLARFRDVFYVTVSCPRLRVDPQALPP